MDIFQWILILILFLFCNYFSYKAYLYFNNCDDLIRVIEAQEFAVNHYYKNALRWKEAIKIHEKESDRHGLYDEIELVFIDLEKEDSNGS